jgi:hypothetical protein
MPAAQPGAELRIDVPAVLAAVRHLEPVLAELAAISSDLDGLAAEVAFTCGTHASGRVFTHAHGLLSAGAVSALDEAHAATVGYADGLVRAVKALVDEDSGVAASVPSGRDH